MKEMNLRMFGKDDTDHLDDFLWFGLDERKEFTNVWEGWFWPPGWVGKVWMKESNECMVRKYDNDHLNECAYYGWKKGRDEWLGRMILTIWMSVQSMDERKEGMNG